MRLSGVTVRISSAVYAVARPRVRVAGGDRRERRPQLAHVRAGARRRRARPRRAARSRTAGRPASARRRSVRHLVVARCPAGRRRAPIGHGGVVAWVQSSQTFGLAPGPPARVHALGAADEHDVALAALDAVGELVDEQLRAVAADGRRRASSRGVDAERGGRAARPGRGSSTRRSATTATVSSASSSDRRGAGVGVGGAAPRRRADRSARAPSSGSSTRCDGLADADEDRACGDRSSGRRALRRAGAVSSDRSRAPATSGSPRRRAVAGRSTGSGTSRRRRRRRRPAKSSLARGSRSTARAQLLLDRGEVVGVGLARLGIVGDLGRRYS